MSYATALSYAHYTGIQCVCRVQRSISVSMSNFVAVGVA